MSYSLDTNYIQNSPSRVFFLHTDRFYGHAGDSFIILLFQTCYVSLPEQFIWQAKSDAKVMVVILLPVGGNSTNYERIVA